MDHRLALCGAAGWLCLVGGSSPGSVWCSWSALPRWVDHRLALCGAAGWLCLGGWITAWLCVVQLIGSAPVGGSLPSSAWFSWSALPRWVDHRLALCGAAGWLCPGGWITAWLCVVQLVGSVLVGGSLPSSAWCSWLALSWWVDHCLALCGAAGRLCPGGWITAWLCVVQLVGSVLVGG